MSGTFVIGPTTEPFLGNSKSNNEQGAAANVFTVSTGGTGGKKGNLTGLISGRLSKLSTDLNNPTLK